MINEAKSDGTSQTEKNIKEGVPKCEIIYVLFVIIT